MKEFATALVIIGAALAWAYYGPRVVSTYRTMRERRLMAAGLINPPLERVAPANDPSVERTFQRIMRLNFQEPEKANRK